jgi:hypothetical protein
MKTEVILVSEIEDYLQYVKLQRDMDVRLKLVLETQEKVLEQMKHIKNTATILKQMKEKYKFNTDKEMVALIRKYARVN